MKRSCTSGPVLVKPQASARLRPSSGKGSPGSVAPTTSNSGVEMCARYQTLGISSRRCGSFASSGLPDSVCSPLTTQALEPSPDARSAGIAPFAAASSAA